MNSSVNSKRPDKVEIEPARNYHLFRGLVVLLAFIVGVMIGFIGWPWSIKR